jgi:hypothetical protein
LEAVLNEQAEEVEKKGRAAEPASAADRATIVDGRNARS